MRSPLARLLALATALTLIVAPVSAQSPVSQPAKAMQPARAEAAAARQDGLELSTADVIKVAGPDGVRTIFKNENNHSGAERGPQGFGAPEAVMAPGEVLPEQIELDIQRNAGSHLIEDVTTITITQLHVTPYGLVKADPTTQALNEDPTPDDPYDNLNDGTVFYITTTVPAGTKRLVAEIAASTSQDIDLYVGLDADSDGPEVSEELALSATGAVLEYVNLDDPAAGTYWILVQNWDASTSAPDVTTLAIAVVPSTDAGNLTVTGPVSVTAGTPYDLRVYWDTPSMVAGDKWYGAFEVGSSASSPGDIGTVNVDITRAADDVAKTVSNANPGVGDILTYTITLQPNVTGTDLFYTLTDTIPSGLTYVSGTVTGGATVTGDTVTWSGVIPAIVSEYLMATSVTDPACAIPLSTADGDVDAYLDLEALSFLADPGIFGNTTAFGVTYSGGSIEYFGEEVGTTVYLADDGFSFFDLGSWQNTDPWINTDIPDSSDPNSILAVLWRDLEIVYDVATNRGVTPIVLSAGVVPLALGIEYDDVEVFGSPSDTYDFEMLIFETVSNAPGDYEIIFAYDNIVGNMSIGTVGVENADGTIGTKFAFDDPALGTITDGMAICFDSVVIPADPVTITYQVMVDSDVAGGTILTNNVEHDTDNPGSLLATTSVDVRVGSRMGLPIISKGP